MSSSSSIIDSFHFAIQQINIYFGLSILIMGIIGGLFNIIIFRTLKTFRETTCAFYLIMASIFNLGQLITGVFVTILADGFNTYITHISYICKIRMFLAQWFGLLSLTSMCLATVDQFFSIKYRYFISLKLARSFITVACLIWTIHGIFFILFWDSFHGICAIININFGIYVTYFHFPILVGFLPLTIMITFSCLAFINLQTTNNRQMNIVRLSHNRQLIAMALIQITYIVIATIPFIIVYIHSLNIKTTNAQIELINTVIYFIYYTTYSDSFYIYCLVSKRFRKQFIYVLITIHLKRRQQQQSNRLNKNQVVPINIQLNGQQNQKKNEDIALY